MKFIQIISTTKEVNLYGTKKLSWVNVYGKMSRDLDINYSLSIIVSNGSPVET
jgi:hypothetical protein